MFLLAMVVLSSACAAIAVAVIRAEAVGAGWRQALPQRLRRRGCGLVLLPAAAMAAAMTGHVHALAAAELAVAGAMVAWAPRLAAKVVPYAVLALAVEGLVLAKAYHDGLPTRSCTGWSSPGPAPGARVWCCRKPPCSSSSAYGCSSWCGRRAPGGSAPWPAAGWIRAVAGSRPPRPCS